MTSLMSAVFVVSQFIRALFPENLEAEKRGRPSTASSKIKVREIVIRVVAPSLDRWVLPGRDVAGDALCCKMFCSLMQVRSVKTFLHVWNGSRSIVKYLFGKCTHFLFILIDYRSEYDSTDMISCSSSSFRNKLTVWSRL